MSGSYRRFYKSGNSGPENRHRGRGSRGRDYHLKRKPNRWGRRQTPLKFAHGRRVWVDESANR